LDLLCTTPYFPTVVITDQGPSEINAIRHAFDFKPRLFYCAWHVLQAWERNFTLKNLGSEDLKTAERKARKDRVSEAFLPRLLMAIFDDIVYLRFSHAGLTLKPIMKGMILT